MGNPHFDNIPRANNLDVNPFVHNQPAVGHNGDEAHTSFDRIFREFPGWLGLCAACLRPNDDEPRNEAASSQGEIVRRASPDFSGVSVAGLSHVASAALDLSTEFVTMTADGDYI